PKLPFHSPGGVRAFFDHDDAFPRSQSASCASFFGSLPLRWSAPRACTLVSSSTCSMSAAIASGLTALCVLALASNLAYESGISGGSPYRFLASHAGRGSVQMMQEPAPT